MKSLISGKISTIDEGLIAKALPFIHLALKYHRYQVKDLQHIPKKKAGLILVNHSLATYDLILLGATIYLKTGRMPFGLADHNFFKFPFLKDLINMVNLREGTHENAEALLAGKELVFVAPGGMREALRPKSERFKIRWDKRTGFAKLAINTQTPIILAACPSADRIYDTYPNSLTKYFYKHFKLPVIPARGLGLSLIPRPVKLTHYISRPLIPPPIPQKQDYQRTVLEFHQKVIEEMESLMRREEEKSR